MYMRTLIRLCLTVAGTLLLVRCNLIANSTKKSASIGVSHKSVSISSIDPVAAAAGSQVLIKGTGVSRSNFTLGDSSANTQPGNGDVLLTVPSGNPGFLDLTATNDSASSQAVFLRLPSSSSDTPIYLADKSNVCSGKSFYDLEGTLQTGTQSCLTSTSIPQCTGANLPYYSSIINSWICLSMKNLILGSSSKEKFVAILKDKILDTEPTVVSKTSLVTCVDEENAGAFIYALGTNSFYYCQNNAWVIISDLSQSEGTGATGATGSTGATGATGSTGASGAPSSFIVKDSSNTTLGLLVGFTDPTDTTRSGTTLVYNTSQSTYFGIRSDGSLANASSPAYEIFQGSNCPGAESPAVAFGGTTPSVPTAASTTLSLAIGSNVYKYPFSSDTSSSLARTSYKVDGGSCVNSTADTPVYSTITTNAGSLTGAFPITEDASGRLYTIVADSGSGLELANCLPTSTNAFCSAGGSWTVGTVGAMAVNTYINLAFDHYGRLYMAGTAGGNMQFGTCAPTTSNQFCADISAWSIAGIRNQGDFGISLVVDDTNDRLYLLYSGDDSNGTAAIILTCTPNAMNEYCTSGGWSGNGYPAGDGNNDGGIAISAAMDSQGRLHAFYSGFRGGGGWKYMTCLPTLANSYCTNEIWSVLKIDDTGAGNSSIAISGSKVIVSYSSASSNAIYTASCTANGASCATGADAASAGWTIGDIDGTSSANSSQITMDPYGTLFAVLEGKIAYCLAGANCSGGGSNWTKITTQAGTDNLAIKATRRRLHAIYKTTAGPQVHMATLADPGLLSLPSYENRLNTLVSPSYGIPLSFVLQQ